MHCTQQLVNAGINSLHESITTPVPDGDDGDNANNFTRYYGVTRARAEPEENQIWGLEIFNKTMPGGTLYGV